MALGFSYSPHIWHRPWGDDVSRTIAKLNGLMARSQGLEIFVVSTPRFRPILRICFIYGTDTTNTVTIFHERFPGQRLKVKFTQVARNFAMSRPWLYAYLYDLHHMWYKQNLMRGDVSFPIYMSKGQKFRPRMSFISKMLTFPLIYLFYMHAVNCRNKYRRVLTLKYVLL